MAKAKPKTHTETEVTPEILIARAHDMIPVLRERATATDEARQLLPENAAAFQKAGFFKTVQPKRYGGFEFDFETMFKITIEVGTGCPSSAWVLCLLGLHNWLVGWWPKAGQDELFANDGNVCIPIVLAPSGTAEKTEGGYSLSGKWAYASGIDNADFVGVAAMIKGLPDDQQAPPLTLMIPSNKMDVIDNWYTIGLRGTGSKIVACKNIFVPEHLCFTLALSEKKATGGVGLHDNPIYHGFPRVPVFSMGGTAPALGATLLMIDAYTDRLQTHVNAYMPGKHLEMSSSQMRLGRAKALYEGASTLFFKTSRKYTDMIMAGEEITIQHRTRFRAQIAETLYTCGHIVDMLMDDAGTGAFVDGSPMQRAFRDVRMIRSHVAMNIENAAQNYGRTELGFDPIPPLF